MIPMRYLETDVMKSIILRRIIDEREATKKERGGYFYMGDGYLPHNHGDSACARQLGYKILKYQTDEQRDDMYPVFALGDLYHDFIQKIFVREGIATQIEECTIMYDDDGKWYWLRQDKNKIIIKENVEIHGRLDIKFSIERSKFIADIKTISERAWNFMNSKPKEPHYAQLQLYLYHFREEKIDKGFILYINKSSGEMKEFLIQYDPEYVSMTLDNYKRLNEYIQSKGLPPRHFRSGEEVPWQCKYCNFTKTCLGLSLEEVNKKTFISYPE